MQNAIKEVGIQKIVGVKGCNTIKQAFYKKGVNMYCNCPDRWVTETNNTYVDVSGDNYIVYICINCKRYYIKRNDKLLEADFSFGSQEWYLTGRIKGIEI